MDKQTAHLSETIFKATLKINVHSSLWRFSTFKKGSEHFLWTRPCDCILLLLHSSFFTTLSSSCVNFSCNCHLTFSLNPVRSSLELLHLVPFSRLIKVEWGFYHCRQFFFSTDGVFNPCAGGSASDEYVLNMLNQADEVRLPDGKKRSSLHVPFHWMLH